MRRSHLTLTIVAAAGLVAFAGPGGPPHISATAATPAAAHRSANVDPLAHVPTPANPVTGGQGTPRAVTGIDFINYPHTSRYRDVLFGDGPFGLAAWSLATPRHPRLIGTLPSRDLLLPGDHAAAGFWEGEHLQVDAARQLVFLARDPRAFGGNEQTGTSGLYIIDAHDPARLRVITFHAVPSGHTTQCIEGCRFLWSGGPVHSGVGHQPKSWNGQPVWVTGVREPRTPYTYPHPVDTHRNDGVTDYVHSTDVSATGLAWASGAGGVHGFYTRGWHTDPVIGHSRLATPVHPIPYAGGKIIQQPEGFTFDHNAYQVPQAVGGFKPGELLLVTDEDFSDTCARQGRLLVVSLAGSYGARWLTADPDPRLRVVGQYGPAGHPGQQPSTACSAHWLEPLTGVGDGTIIVEAFYGQGTRFIDYHNPRHPSQVGYFAPAGKVAATPAYHDGLVYAASYSDGIDVLRFTPPAS